MVFKKSQSNATIKSATTPAKKSFSKKIVGSSLAIAALAVSATFMPPHKQADASTITYPPTSDNVKPVFFVGNNWDGTVTVIKPEGNYEQIATIDMVPDRALRMAEVWFNPIQFVAFYYIRNTAGEGNDQLVDDMYSTADGKSIVASRPSFADVVSIDIETGEINWRFKVDGFRADHMAVSPDGKSLAVSASSGNVVHVLDIYSGEALGKFETGDKPHENIYFADGKKILNSSIGNVETSFDAPWQDFTKGDRIITIADVDDNYKVSRTLDFRKALDDFGRTELSNAVRPAVFSPDEKTLYAQVSFFNGLVEYDMTTDKVTRVTDLPGSDTIPDSRTDYVNDSRHHGLSINDDGSKLCVAGTMDDYVTIVDTATMRAGKLIQAGKPYWATVTPDGENCLISESETDSVTIVNFETGEKVITVPVGNHPQRVRYGYVPANWQG